MNDNEFRVKVLAALDRIAANLERLKSNLERLDTEATKAADQIRTFDQPSTVKRYVSGETQPAAEGDWQLHNEGHEGEETE